MIDKVPLYNQLKIIEDTVAGTHAVDDRNATITNAVREIRAMVNKQPDDKVFILAYESLDGIPSEIAACDTTTQAIAELKALRKEKKYQNVDIFCGQRWFLSKGPVKYLITDQVAIPLSDDAGPPVPDLTGQLN